MSAVRVGIVGARRVRQGLGPFVARDLVAAGASVPCFLVTRSESLEPARAEIERQAGVSPRGYTDAERMYEREELDAVAILSPAETHAEQLERAAAHGLPALCEKPLVWGEEALARRAAECVGAFEGRGLLLYENCQWPFALPAFERLHPGSLDAPPQRFAMELQPESRGLQALGDSLSHPLSLLQALLPGDAPEVAGTSFSPPPASGPPDALSVRFDYRSGGRSCAVELRLSRAEALPRRAAIELDGRSALRVVAPESYRLSFAASDRVVPMDDPLTRLIADFVRSLEAADEARRHALARGIEQRMQLLEELTRAYAAEETP